ncbi:MAG: GAF and ANTAR domain-containing protein [Friedmanniella sp.]|jgi:transcriptional regulator with GAF, ATPase, and Fis domain
MHTEHVEVGTADQAAVEAARPALEQVIGRAKQAFTCDAVTMLRETRDGALEVAASSEAAARRADQLQLGHGEGPALNVRRDAEICLSGDLGADPRWPRWGPDVVELGWLSVLSAPLVTPEQDLGILTLYCHRAGAFDATHGYAARIFAEYAATALTYACETEGLREAITARHRIGLAQGILMEQHNLTSEEAFSMMRRYSQANNVKVRAVAEQVIETGAFPGGASRSRRVRRRPTV